MCVPPLDMILPWHSQAEYGLVSILRPMVKLNNSTIITISKSSTSTDDWGEWPPYLKSHSFIVCLAEIRLPRESTLTKLRFIYTIYLNDYKTGITFHWTGY